jgi:hypothetical protein
MPVSQDRSQPHEGPRIRRFYSVARGGIEPPTYRFSAGQVRAMCYPPYLLALLTFRTSSAAAITLSLKAARPQ